MDLLTLVQQGQHAVQAMDVDRIPLPSHSPSNKAHQLIFHSHGGVDGDALFLVI